MAKPDKKLKELMRILADAIGQVFSGNEEIRHALSMIEREGYHVDLILASVTRLSRKEEEQISNSDSEVSNFDRTFLKKIRVRLNEDI